MKLHQFMVHCPKVSGAIFVKEREFFVQQGGDKEPWGKHWELVEAENLEHAREIGCAIFPWAKPYKDQLK